MKKYTAEAAINKMFEVAGYNTRVEHLKLISKAIPDWYSRYWYTRKDETVFRNWFVKNYGKSYWPWFNLMYGLRVKDA
jgi:hypothetical protein